MFFALFPARFSVLSRKACPFPSSWLHDGQILVPICSSTQKLINEACIPRNTSSCLRIVVYHQSSCCSASNSNDVCIMLGITHNSEVSISSAHRVMNRTARTMTAKKTHCLRCSKHNLQKDLIYSQQGNNYNNNKFIWDHATYFLPYNKLRYVNATVVINYCRY